MSPTWNVPAQISNPVEHKLLSRVCKAADELAKAEEFVAMVRSNRNQMMYRAMKSGVCTERDVASAARVSPAYAHRVKVGEGDPASGVAREAS